jgi:hypothetical protein
VPVVGEAAGEDSKMSCEAPLQLAAATDDTCNEPVAIAGRTSQAARRLAIPAAMTRDAAPLGPMWPPASPAG